MCPGYCTYICMVVCVYAFGGYVLLRASTRGMMMTMVVGCLRVVCMSYRVSRVTLRCTQLNSTRLARSYSLSHSSSLSLSVLGVAEEGIFPP